MKKEQAMPNFVEMEKSVLKFWDDKKVFENLKEKNKKTGKYFATLDGPITANYIMGLHHAYGRTYKDAMIKYQAMKGCDMHYQNGFDAHGLPVELRVEGELGLDSKKEIEKYGIDKFVEQCLKTVEKYSALQTESSKRLGQWMNWDDSYFTNSDSNITAIWHFLKKCQEKNWLSLAYRPMPWCTRCGTSLSEHEMSDADAYKDVTCQAIFFKCPILGTNNDILVWTTTPWTLSSNVAVAVNPELEYNIVKIKSSERNLIVLKDAMKVLKEDVDKVVGTVKGSELVGLTYETCFPELPEQNFEHKIVAWDAVDATEGSGAVHIAPGCGAEDFELGKKLGLKNIIPIDEAGRFYSNFGVLSGMDANSDETRDFVFSLMKERNKTYYTHKYTHRYPHCWRCKHPLLFRLVEQWVIKMDEIRPQLISAVDKVEFQPEFMKKRMLDWLNNMGDWAISRSRYYGIPLPFYPCKKCGKVTVVGSLAELEKLSSKEEVAALPHIHRPHIDKIKITCPHCGEKVERIKEVGDCWLDAGITPFSTNNYFTDKAFFEKNFPVECVIEGKEQIRLWFYSLLVMSVVLTGKAPYKKISTYPMLLAQDGKKLSKSSPNNIPLDVVFNEIGADIVRYNFVNTPLINDVKFGRETCDEVRRKLLGLWNAYIFLNTYACIDKPDLTNYKPDEKSLLFIDRWLINRVNEFASHSDKEYAVQNFGAIVKDFEVLIDELTNWYIRNNRRRFYKSENGTDKLNAYFCLNYAIKNIAMTMFPIIPFFSEYLWQNCVRELDKNAPESVALFGFNPCEFKVEDHGYTQMTDFARNIMSTAQRLRNENQIKVKQPLKKMYVSGSGNIEAVLKEMGDIIKDELNVKELECVSDDSMFNDEYLSVNFKKAGAVLKGDVQKLKTALAGLSEEENAKVMTGYKAGKVTVGEFSDLDSELFNLEKKPKQDFVIAHENGNTVVLDINLDKALIMEGLYREFVRSLQVLRKDADFAIDQRIYAYIEVSNDELAEMLFEFKDKIKQEVLILRMVELDDMQNPDIERTVEVGDGTVLVKLKAKV